MACHSAVEFDFDAFISDTPDVVHWFS